MISWAACQWTSAGCIDDQLCVPYIYSWTVTWIGNIQHLTHGSSHQCWEPDHLTFCEYIANLSVIGAKHGHPGAVVTGLVEHQQCMTHGPSLQCWEPDHLTICGCIANLSVIGAKHGHPGAVVNRAGRTSTVYDTWLLSPMLRARPPNFLWVHFQPVCYRSQTWSPRCSGKQGW